MSYSKIDQFNIGDKVLIRYDHEYREAIITAKCGEFLRAKYKSVFFARTIWLCNDDIKGIIQEPLTTQESELLDQLAK